MIVIGKENKEVYFQKCRSYTKRPIRVRATKINDPFIVKTLEGDMRGKSGDFLVEGINGEVYPVDKKIFKKTFVLEEK